MTTPTVTLGVPVYNGGSTLRATLDSLLAQDFTDFELLVSDNASTDDTATTVAEYMRRDSRISYFANPVNVGAARNYNALVERAQGRYFKWASADDLIHPALLTKCIAALDRDPGAVLAYGRTVLIDEEGRRLAGHKDGLHLWQDEPWLRLRDFAMRRNLCNPCFGVIRTEVLRTTDLVRPNVSSDITLLAQLALRGRFTELPEELFYRRVAATSCGLGGLSRRAAGVWFDPTRRAPIAPLVRVFRDIVIAILTAGHLPVQVRMRTLAAFTAAWNKRQLGIAVWRLRRRLRGGRRSSVYETVSQVA